MSGGKVECTHIFGVWDGGSTPPHSVLVYNDNSNVFLYILNKYILSIELFMFYNGSSIVGNTLHFHCNIARSSRANRII